MIAQRRKLDALFGERRAPQATSLPQPLSAGIEALSGLDMSGVRVYRNSDQPAQLNAHAYTQGQAIHLGPGQEQHLAHEAWHVVQQQQGRVHESTQLAGVPLNDDPALEHEADVMGAKAAQARGDSHGDVEPLQLRTNLSVIQRLKFKDPGPRKVEIEKWQPAAPFQLAAVQFSADYDIAQYATEIRQYVQRCREQQTIPVIELRMYDAALSTSVIEYLGVARKSLLPIVGDEYFDLVCSLLRDETQAPKAIEPPELQQMEAALKEFAEWLKQVAEVAVSGPLTQGAEKKAALNPPAGKMLAGGMMIPLEEALSFVTLTGQELEAISEQKAARRYSMHERLLAKILMTSPKPKVSEPTRLRRNSLGRPDTVTITNLVTGDETQTLQSTVAACQAAMAKGARQVYLIIEVTGYTQNQRAMEQIEALKKKGLEVEVVQDIEAAKGVQQSGVMLNEPGKAIPKRVKVRVTKG
jgi:hypothetical protein